MNGRPTERDKLRVQIEELAAKLRSTYPHLNFQQRKAIAEIVLSNGGDGSHAKDTR
jgi:hypothetical protein